MPIFKKKSDDVLDLTDLKRRGLFKFDEDKEKVGREADSSGYFDFSQSSSAASSEPSQDEINKLIEQSSQQAQQEDSGASALGFLDTFASSASPSSEQSSYFSSSSSSESSLSSGGSSSGSDSLEIQGLKNKIEDLEYKLRVLEDKISRLDG